MSYIEENKAAWEEAFEHRRPGWGEKDHERLLGESLPFFCPDVAKELRRMDYTGRAVAQFCCNNGRELLSLMGLGPAEGVGFDIAENIIAQAVDTAEKAGVRNCRFVACNILDIPPEYHGRFDLIFFTIGAITWFEDLNPLFRVVSDCLKPGGVLLIHDFHPVMNMLPLPGEPEFDAGDLNRVAHSYFRTEPWLENEGMGYLSEQYPSKTFTSFSHTMAAILNAVSGAGLTFVRLDEYDYDVGLTDAYDQKGFPLSYLLRAEKRP
ncbi:class I SAM-dependent methyltransferase [Pseudoflavonifractor phocaeensis]|uniref:class I SAM-dependent methyltransferase n=1 Tax=Pseudoflavonifractor phocaeensis TaxID=1870988 RepID=UPI00313ACE69